jgi:hypothetical protein
MTQLMLGNDLRSSEQDSEVRTLAQVRTLKVLRRLGPERTKTVLRYLCGEEGGATGSSSFRPY